MARLSTLTVGGLKATDRTLALDSRNLLLGPVGGGKTTIEDAIAFLALGYVPRLGKTAAATGKLLRAGCDRIEVSATLDDGRSVRRALVRSGKSLTEDVEASWIGVDENPSVHGAAITGLFGATPGAAEQHVDIRALLSATPNERARHVSAMLDATGLQPEVAKALADAYLVLRIADVDLPPSLDQAKSLSDAYFGTFQGAVYEAADRARQRLAALWGKDPIAETIAKLRAEKNEARQGAREKGGARKELEQAKIDAKAQADAVPDLEKREAEAREKRARARERLEREERLGGERASAQSLLAALDAQRPEVTERHEAAIKAVTTEIPALAERAQGLRELFASVIDPPEIPAPAAIEPSPEALAEATRMDAEAEALTLPSDLIRSLEAKIVDLERRDREIVLPEAASTDAELSILKAAEAEVDRAKSSPWRHVEAVALKVLGFFATTTPVPPTPIVEAIESLIPFAEKHGGGLEDSERALEQAREKLATARERAATVTRERERLTLEQGRIRNDLTGARRELAKAREDRQLEASARRKAAADVRKAAHDAAKAGNAAARQDYEAKASQRRAKVEANAQRRKDIASVIAEVDGKQKAIEAEGRAAQAAVDKLQADTAAAKAKLEGLAAGGCDVESVRVEFRAAEEQLADLGPKFKTAREQGARVAEMNRLIDEIEQWQARGDAFAAAEWAVQRVQAMDLAARAGGIEARMREFLAAAGRTEEPYLRSEKNTCEFGWRTDGAEVAIEALSGGEFAIFSTALAYAVTAIRKPEIRFLAVEAAELGSSEPVYQLLRGLEGCAENLDQVFVATNASIEPPAGWTVHTLGRVRSREGAVA